MDHVIIGYSLIFLSGGGVLAWWACGRRARRTAQAQPREAQRAREQEAASGDLSEAAREITQLELHVRERTSELAITKASQETVTGFQQISQTLDTPESGKTRGPLAEAEPAHTSDSVSLPALRRWVDDLAGLLEGTQRWRARRS